MQGLSVLVLRYKQPEEPEWKVPLNFRIAGREFPLGLGLITLALFALAVLLQKLERPPPPPRPSSPPR